MERQQTDERQRQIAQAALAIIAEEGLGRFTIGAIARRVGLSEGALFRHFKSKQDMVVAAIGLVEEMFFQDFPPAGNDPLERLGAQIRHRLALLERHPFLVRLIFSRQLAQASGPGGSELVARMQARTLEFIRSCLVEAEAKGLLREGLHADELTVVVFGSVLGAANRDLYGAVLPEAAARRIPATLWDTVETLLRR